MQDGRDVLLPLMVQGIKILFVQDAADAVDGLVIYRKARQAVFLEHGGDVVHRFAIFHRNDVHPRGEDVAGGLIVQLDGGADQLPLLFVDGTAALHLIHDGDQFFFRYAAAVFVPDQAGQQFFPLAEEGVHRCQHYAQRFQDWGGQHGEAVGALFGEAFGGDFTEYQHHHRHHDGRQGHSRVSEVSGEQDRRQRSGGDIDDVVADEDGGEQAVVILTELQRALRPPVSRGGHIFDTDAVEAGKSGLRCGKVTGQQDQERENQDHHQTVDIHTDENPLCNYK